MALESMKLFCVAAIFSAACGRTPSATPAPEPASIEPNKVSYRASGTEPFWAMTVSERELRVTWPEPEPSITTSYTIEQRSDGRTYKGKSLTATVTIKTCSDGMSDRIYPHTVKLELGERTLNGCGYPEGYNLGPPP
jgi:uncharacterized membrane protein